MHPPPLPSPPLNIPLPLKIGKTLRPRSPSRHLLALKFSHIPDKASLSLPSVLHHTANQTNITLATQDARSSVPFVGTRRTHASNAVRDYMLVVVNGTVWLERMHDFVQGIRPVDPGRSDRPRIDVPEREIEEGEGDSWMMGEKGSPITPEGGGASAGKSVGGKSVARKSVKEESESEESSEESGSDSESESEDSDGSGEYTDRSSDEDE